MHLITVSMKTFWIELNIQLFICQRLIRFDMTEVIYNKLSGTIYLRHIEILGVFVCDKSSYPVSV